MNVAPTDFAAIGVSVASQAPIATFNEWPRSQSFPSSKADRMPAQLAVDLIFALTLVCGSLVTIRHRILTYLVIGLSISH